MNGIIAHRFLTRQAHNVQYRRYLHVINGWAGVVEKAEYHPRRARRSAGDPRSNTALTRLGDRHSRPLTVHAAV